MSDWNIADFTGISADSRDIRPGFLFAALPGAKANGLDYVAQAVANGATGVLVEARADLPPLPDAIRVIKSENPRKTLSDMAASFYGGRQPQTMVAVTGTNGKTSVVWFTQQLWRFLGHKSVSIGTLGVHGDVVKEGKMTTPDPVRLHEILSEMEQHGITHAAMESSSHGLHQHRMDAVRLAGACFTNLTRDHLDYHGQMQDYFQAKKRLFSEVLKKDSVAIIHDQGEWNLRLIDWVKGSGLTLICYGSDAADIGVHSLRPTPHGTDAELSVCGHDLSISTRLIGDFQIENLMAALGLVIGTMKEAERAQAIQTLSAHINRIAGVPGRMEVITGHPDNAVVSVDYAHTPEALQTVLQAVRPHVQGRLICVFGCGGDRDEGKRLLMAAAVKENADIGILTDDNPRSEDPARIRAQARQGHPDVIEVAGRRQAIDKALQMAQDGDHVVVAGKGHEQGQEIAGDIHPFDDRDVVREGIKTMQEASQ